MVRFAAYLRTRSDCMRLAFAVIARAGSKMMVDTCARFAYKRALAYSALRPFERPVKFRPPLSCVAPARFIGHPSGSSFVNVIVDAGSSSVRIQWAVAARCFEQSNHTKKLAVWFASLDRSRELSLTIAGGTR